MSADMGRKAGVFFLGAAALSLLFPSRRNSAPAPSSAPSSAPTSAPGPASSPAEPPKRPAAALPPRRMWALVQVRPEVQVLAISASRAELERELAEINETWNHWELRDERQRYVIQPAPVLFPQPPEPGPSVSPVGRERSAG